MSNDLLTYKICGQYPGEGGGVLLYISRITGAHKGCIVLGSFWSENGYKRRSSPGHKMGFRSSVSKSDHPGEGKHEGLVRRNDVLTNGFIGFSLA